MQQDAAWDLATIRRSMRLLGTHSTRVSDVQSTARALRLVWDMLQRRNIQTELFQLPGLMPLVVAGHGPVLVITYFDDTSPFCNEHSGDPPGISDDLASGPGVIRKAGVLSVLGAFLSDPEMARRATLVIEADRHGGSPALEAWLQSSERRFGVGLYEVADLPVVAPAIFLSSTGAIILDVSVQRSLERVEQFYGGVLPDVGHQLVEAVSALKSRDAEVLIPNFYDSVAVPDATGLAALNGIASSVGVWITRHAGATGDLLGASHLTLGVFCAPALLVRELEMESSGPFLQHRARATIEIRVMPGQDVHALIAATRSFIQRRVPGATVEPLLTRPATTGWTHPLPDLSAARLPVTPGDSPAGVMEAAGMPTLGFSTVHRDASALAETVSFASITQGTRLVNDLVSAVEQRVARNEHGVRG